MKMLLLTILLIQVGVCQMWQNFTSNRMVGIYNDTKIVIYATIVSNEIHNCPEVKFCDELGNINVSTLFRSKNAVQDKLILNMMIYYLNNINKIGYIKDYDDEEYDEGVFFDNTAFTYDSLGWRGSIVFIKSINEYMYTLALNEYPIFIQLSNLKWIYDRI